MNIKGIQTHRIECGEKLEDILDLHITQLSEGSILAITSKIISLCQERVVSKKLCSKADLIRQEADAIADASNSLYNTYLTIKNHILILSAGIDESNGDDVYILYPENIQTTAGIIWSHLREKHNLKHLGIVITDSHTTPMRRGVTGIALGWCGFEPFYSYIGEPDLYGHPLRVTQTNLLDALATSAVLVMGEGCEQTPIAIIQDAPKIRFQDRLPTNEEEKQVVILMEEDLYAPLLTGISWIKKDKHS